MMTALDALPALPYQGLGLGGIVALLIILLFTGRVVVRFVYDEMVTERNYWRDKYNEGEAVRRDLINQNSVLVESVAAHARNDEITVSLLRSIRLDARIAAGGDPDATLLDAAREIAGETPA